jgi:hypothetical protein
LAQPGRAPFLSLLSPIALSQIVKGSLSLGEPLSFQFTILDFGFMIFGCQLSVVSYQFKIFTA